MRRCAFEGKTVNTSQGNVKRTPAAIAAPSAPAGHQRQGIRRGIEMGRSKYTFLYHSARNRKFADSPLEGGGFELPVPGIRSSIFIPPRRHSSLFGELAERVRHRVRRLKPRPTAPACHVESPIDDFLLPLSARRVRVFMHTRTEVVYAPVAGGGL